MFATVFTFPDCSNHWFCSGVEGVVGGDRPILDLPLVRKVLHSWLRLQVAKLYGMAFENMSVDSIVGDRLKSSITGLMDSDKETGFFTLFVGNNEVSRKKPGFCPPPKSYYADRTLVRLVSIGAIFSIHVFCHCCL